ncbi:MAG: hypothetical protein ACTS27_09905 [Phycisphaerales bacterium]
MNTTRATKTFRLAALLAGGLPMTGAAAGIVYQQDFENPSTIGWNLGGPGISHTDALGNFSKRNTNNEVTLTVNTAQSEVYTLVFDLYLFGEWSGNSSRWGQNTFSVRAEGTEILRDTFSNTGDPNSQSYGEAPDVLGDLGYSPDTDSAYRQIALLFNGRNPSVTLRFMGQGLGNMGQTSWALDNVEVHEGDVRAAFVPSPATAGVLGAPLLFALRRRRAR